MHRRSLPAALATTAAVIVLTGCSAGSSPAPATTTTVAQAAAPSTGTGPNEQICHSKALGMMTQALLKDGNFDKLPKLPDRSLGIPECKGLSTAQLDSIAAQLKGELQPLLLGAAASQAGKTATP